MRFATLLIFIFFSLVVLAQDILVPEWMITRKSPLVLGVSEAWAIGLDENKNIYWGVNQDMPGQDIRKDAMVYKFDSDTNEIWLEHAVSFEHAQQSYNLKVTDSLVYIVGRSCNTDGVDSCEALIFTVDHLTGTTEQITIWTRGFGYEEIDGIHFESDGILLTGWTRSASTAMDLLILKIDYQGNELWKTVWGSGEVNRDDHQDGHVVVDDSMIYVSGLYNGTSGLWSGFEGRALLAKFDKTNGQFVDSVVYGREDSWLNAENGLGMTTDGEFLYCTGVSTTIENNWDLFVTKYDKNLNQIWYTPWGGDDAESARSLHVASDGNIYLVGNTKSYGAGDMDVLFLKLNANGIPQWFKTWGQDKDDQTLDFYVDEKDFYITGKSKSLHTYNLWQAFLLKVNLDSIASIDNQIKFQNEESSLFPNPMTTHTNLKFNNPNYETIQVNLKTIDGKIIRSLSTSSDHLVLYRDDLIHGTYLLEILQKGKNILSKKLLIN